VSSHTTPKKSTDRGGERKRYGRDGLPQREYRGGPALNERAMRESDKEVHVHVVRTLTRFNSLVRGHCKDSENRPQAYLRVEGLARRYDTIDASLEPKGGED